jgi:hypothetical protein
MLRPMPPPQPLPQPLLRLVESIERGHAIAVVGSGLSCAAGIATWDALLIGLCEVALAVRPDRRADLAWALQAVERGRYLDAGSMLRKVLEAEFVPELKRQLGLRRQLQPRPQAIAAVLRGEEPTGPLVELQAPDVELTPRPTLSHRILVQLGFRAIVTTNFDDLLERACPYDRPTRSYSWSYTGLAELLVGDPIILKLHGDLAHPGDIIFAREDYRGPQFTSRAREACRALLGTSRPLWLGYGHNDPDLDLLIDEGQATLGISGGFALDSSRDSGLALRLEHAKISRIPLGSHADVPRYLQQLAVRLGKPVSFSIVIDIPWPGEAAATRLGQAISAALQPFGIEPQLWACQPGSVTLYFELDAPKYTRLRSLLEQRDLELLLVLVAHRVTLVEGVAISTPVTRVDSIPSINEDSPVPRPVASELLIKLRATNTKQQALQALLVGLFTVPELSLVLHPLIPEDVYLSIHWDRPLPTVVFDVVGALERSALITPALFAALHRARSNRAAEIDHMHHLYLPAQMDVEAAAPQAAARATVAERDPETLRRFSLFSRLLDRTIAWTTLLEQCKQAPGPLAFLLHGTGEQNLRGFLDRISRHFDEDLPDPAHAVHDVAFDEDDGPTATAAEWESRLRIAAGSRGRQTTADVLKGVLAGRPGMFVIRGAGDGPLQHLAGQELAALVDFLSRALPTTLEQLRVKAGKKRLRILIPLEHDPYGSGVEPADPAWVAIVGALKAQTSMRFICLPELMLPRWQDEVRPSIELFLSVRGIECPPELLQRCFAAFNQQTAQGSFAALADAIYHEIDPLLRKAARC